MAERNVAFCPLLRHLPVLPERCFPEEHGSISHEAARSCGSAPDISGLWERQHSGAIQLSLHGTVTGTSLTRTTDMTSRGLFGTVTNSSPPTLTKQ
jgi:hypothetical protein